MRVKMRTCVCNPAALKAAEELHARSKGYSTSVIGVPGHSLGNPPVVGFCLGLGGVPGESPVAGQLSGNRCVPG
jgi:hypothetical protein